jgi:hypothetical protein
VPLFPCGAAPLGPPGTPPAPCGDRQPSL